MGIVTIPQELAVGHERSQRRRGRARCTGNCDERHKCRYKLACMQLATGDTASALIGFEAIAQVGKGELAPEAKAFAAFLARAKVELPPQSE